MPKLPPLSSRSQAEFATASAGMTESTGTSPHWKAASVRKNRPSKNEGGGASRSLGNDLIALLWATGAVLLCVALASYRATDPSLNTMRTGNAPILNDAGIVGAYTADFLLQLFGAAAFGLVVLFTWFAQARLRQLPMERRWWVSGLYTIGWLLLAAAALHWNRVTLQKIIPVPFPMGGFLGMVVADQFHFWLGVRGGAITLASVFVVMTAACFEFNPRHFVIAVAMKLQSFWMRVLEGLITLCEHGKNSFVRGVTSLGTCIQARVRTLGLHVRGWLKNKWDGIAWYRLPLLGRFFKTPVSLAPHVNLPVALSAYHEHASYRSESTDRQGFSGHSGRSSEARHEHASDNGDDDTKQNTFKKRFSKKERSVDVTPPSITEAPEGVRPQIDESLLAKGAGEVPAAPFEDDSSYEFPSFDLLEDPVPGSDPNLRMDSFHENSKRLTQKLSAFGVHGTVETICPGPVITMYEFKPKEEVKISRIANLADDLSLALSAESVRIIAPIPGKSVVGIEIPNEKRDAVALKEILGHGKFKDSPFRIPIAVGKDIAGEPFVADLAQMPHLLVAGTTGSGKSVFVNAVICSILYRFTPSQVKMILIDPKMVELSVYDEIPHLLLPVVTDSQKASLALQWAVDEMERRYEMLHDLQVRNIDSYNLKLQNGIESGTIKTDGPIQHSHLPYIVIVVDELADLMMTCPKDVEISIARLAQKARAAGVHLILATQRPDTNVITGTIKSNFSSRVSFRVGSRVDSGTILDDKGAEKLLGKGDMLTRLTGMTRISRLHGAYVGEREVEQIVNHVRSQGEPTYDENILKPRDDGNNAGITEEEYDEIYDSAVEVATRERVVSVSMLQRRLRIGFNRAARIFELMERQGLIAPSDGTSRPRKVLAPPPPEM